MQIRKAQRCAIKIKLAITGPSGSGKTLGALLLAKGLVGDGRILVIDSEDGSSNLYSDHKLTAGVDYDVLELDAPYNTQKYIEALALGQKEGYDVIVIDSISHAWAGEGGILDKKNAIDSRGGNSFTNWGKVTKDHELFKSKIVHAKCHVIVTMRSKQEYIIESNDKGKQAPRKVGLAPVQREGMEYEFTTVFDCAMDHTYEVSKDRTGLFDGRMEKLSIDTGAEIKDWLSGGAEAPPEPDVGAVAEALQVCFDDKLDGSWEEAKPLIGGLNAAQRDELKEIASKEVVDWIRANMLMERNKK
jgi:hypothetical protein